MGFVRSKIYRLRFEDPDFEGLEVRATAPSLGERLEVSELFSGDHEGESVKERNSRVVKIYEAMMKHFVEWNLENADGSPVACDIYGLLTQDREFVDALAAAWLAVAVTVEPPLSKGSNGGGQFPEELIPMDELSSSLPN